jgi:hypothetical protein
MLSGMSRLFLWACIGLCVVGFGFGPVLAEEPEQLAPSTPWHVDYADDSCTLARSFGEGDDTITVVMRRFEPINSFSMTLVGRPFRRARMGGNVTLRFGPAEAEQEVSFFTGDVRDIPALILQGSVRVVPLTPEEEERLNAMQSGYFDENSSFWRQSVAPERIQAVEYMFLDAWGVSPVVLRLDHFGAAFDAFDQCLDELLTHWGIDVERHENLTRPAWPVGSPGNWIRSSDYPSEMLHRGGQAIVNFRLSINENGGVSDCHIQQTTRPEGFADLVCRLLIERGEFTPALDANGVPIASYFVSTVRFQIGR